MSGLEGGDRFCAGRCQVGDEDIASLVPEHVLDDHMPGIILGRYLDNRLVVLGGVQSAAGKAAAVVTNRL